MGINLIWCDLIWLNWDMWWLPSGNWTVCYGLDGPFSSLVYLFKVVIFNSYVNIYQRVLTICLVPVLSHSSNWPARFYPATHPHVNAVFTWGKMVFSTQLCGHIRAFSKISRPMARAWQYSGWWYTYPSEKYKFVNGKDDIPYMKWKINFMFETTNQI